MMVNSKYKEDLINVDEELIRVGTVLEMKLKQRRSLYFKNLKKVKKINELSEKYTNNARVHSTNHLEQEF